MKTKAVRIYGKEDLRLEEFELPQIKDNEILAKIVVDSICMSTYKLAMQGSEHKRVTNDLTEHPSIIGHEMCGEILEVGKEWKDRYQPGKKFVMQVNLPNQMETPGYSYEYVGGDATYVVIPNEVMANDCLLSYNGDTYYEGALIEPLSCLVAAFKSNYHVGDNVKVHQMGIKENGAMLMIGATGPMGLLGVDLALHGDKRPSKLIVTDIDSAKLDRARKLYTSEEVDVEFVNTKDVADVENFLRELSGGNGYDDIFVFAPVPQLVTLGSALLNTDGCLNFFAGPSDKKLSATINIYDIHYSDHHYVGTSGGDTEDMRDAIRLIEEKKVDVSKIVTHILGLNEVAEITMNQTKLGGGKKIVYTHKDMAYTNIEELGDLTPLGKIIKDNNGVWSKEAEDYILENVNEI
ncbi:zinc-binding dehydrogenase [Alkalibacter mobilis]|uniref:zinc-binding dehydrogenase n=1 Tax=Alkalibacter mobilis TaxID=2787712 RepID=UPI00189EC0E4|nr:zinc-binding dehydrogenase [Alkalibacter mobilis]MBF7097366.1 zinc-binding dehydrogenase [Alkalibacter mobilis]